MLKGAFERELPKVFVRPVLRAIRYAKDEKGNLNHMSGV